MGKIVAGKIERIGLVPRGHQREGAIARKRPGQIDQFAIDARGQRRLGKAGTNGNGHIGGGGASRHFAGGAVGQGNGDDIRHGQSP